VLRVATRDEDKIERRRLMEFVKPMTTQDLDEDVKEEQLLTTQGLIKIVNGVEVAARRASAAYLELTKEFHHPVLIKK